MMKLVSYGFNGRTNPARISVCIAEDGKTHIFFPGCVEPCVVSKGHPIGIDVSGNGPGPDVAILIEAVIQ